MSCSVLTEPEIEQLHKIIQKCEDLVKTYKLEHPVELEEVDILKEIKTEQYYTEREGLHEAEGHFLWKTFCLNSEGLLAVIEDENHRLTLECMLL